MHDFPLFPLDLVALPHELIPLHILEERFETMWNECLRAECEFGIVWLSDDSLCEIDCACGIDRVLEGMEDGRMNLLARGTRPFRVLERVGRLGYPAGVIEFVDDREEPLDPDAAAGRKAACGCATIASATSTGRPSITARCARRSHSLATTKRTPASRAPWSKKPLPKVA